MTARRASAAPGAGVLPIDKPAGPTSHDVVAQARRALGERRIGHTGTLDPFASGLLLLCVGKATRLAEYLVGLPKRYEAVARLGERTDTDDGTGTVVERSDAWTGLDERNLAEALQAQVGRRAQTPPAYSAKKVGGERLYEKARRGEAVTPEPVEIEIHEIVLREVRLPEVGFEVTCSSGTYIRSIARDLGDALGVHAHLTALRRTHVGDFSLTGAVTLDALGDAAAVGAALLDPLAALAHLPRIDVDAAAARALGMGQSPETERALDGGPVVVAHEGELVAIAEIEGGRLRPRKVLAGA